MIDELKARYRRGGLGDSVVKRHLDEVLQALLAPIRERRARYAADPGYVMDLLRQGTFRARERTQATLTEVRSGLGIFSL
jgi:tryptophanyl-tRNA synthetase